MITQWSRALEKTLIMRELHNFHSSPKCIRVIKSRRMRQAGDAVRLGDVKNAYKILENLKGRDHSEDRCKSERNIKMNFRETGLKDVDYVLMS
jgi:hypothetical protein